MILNRKSTDVFKDVAEFAELAQPDMLVPIGAEPLPKAIELAIKLLEEEKDKEYIPALQAYKNSRTKENLVAVIDAGMDSIYVIAWAMRVLNAPAQACWNEVQRSNMAKFPPAIINYEPVPLDLPEYKDIPVEVNEVTTPSGNRWILTNADTGKVMKPKGWTPPNLHAVLHEAEQIHKMRTMPDQVATGAMIEYFHFNEARREAGEIDL